MIVADLTRGTGRFNVSQGAVATTQGLGAALSATLAGVIIVAAGYSVAFLVLAAIAAVGFMLYLVAMPETQGLCGASRDVISAGGQVPSPAE